MRAADFSDRYFMQWLTAMKEGNLMVVGYCVRDKKSPSWTVVFRHEEADVCRKVAKLLNEGVRDGLSE